MPKPGRPHGTIPAAFSATGQEVPPSPEVAAQGVAEVIGGTVAVHVAQLLGPVLQRLVDVQDQPACIVCAVNAKREHLTAVANALAAAEPEPGAPVVRQSFTSGRRGPVCWGCLDPDQDGPEKFRTLNDERAAHGLPPFKFPEASLPYLPPAVD